MWRSIWHWTPPGPGEQVCIADLDIVNPYFRTADNAEFLRTNGVKPLVPQYANTNVEIPTLPETLGEVFYGEGRAIVDVGGDPEGAAALGCDRDRYEAAGYDMYFVCNFTVRPHCAQRTRCDCCARRSWPRGCASAGSSTIPTSAG